MAQVNDYKMYISNDGGYMYNQINCGDDWTIKKDWNMLDYMTFSSEISLSIGTHVRFQNGDVVLFTGQILKLSVDSSKINVYEALSYGLVLRSEVTKTFKNKTSSAILRWIRNRTPSLTFKIGNTTKKHTELVFEKKTMLEIIQNLIWIEYNLGNLIEFHIDDRLVTFKPLPGTVKGYTITNALDFSGDISFENVATGYTVTVNGKVVKVVNSEYLQALFGTIYVNQSLTQDSDKKPWTSTQIKKIVKGYSKKFYKLKYNEDTPNWATGYLNGESNDYLLSVHLMEYMKANNIGGQIVYYKKAGKTQYSVLYKIGNKTFRFPYSAYDYDAGFRDSTNALKGTVLEDW